ncbi:MAG: hypothetical protein GTO45_40775 [Candidatus Aminicenantes bacterium]|nr:hypothetical protein [Candidatus Aminicenantes bacterium]NIN48217.1 hypothetical protein [Candidatus Aminicenantes bacterium]NIN91120.1 hypothetical protein [Candidatus Aminicenantes bacterium]NIO87919.1 hypothetical protein [Candidatus Aminicenantes bacterium]NIQ73662.1 hypothetical protein [Candidatus Aminicenantes bacterium]
MQGIIPGFVKKSKENNPDNPDKQDNLDMLNSKRNWLVREIRAEFASLTINWGDGVLE